MTIQAWNNAGAGSALSLGGQLATNSLNDSNLMTMRAPLEVPTPLWNLSSASERRAMVEALPMMAAGAAAAFPTEASVTGQAAIDLGALMRAATAGIGPYAGIFLRAGVISLPLMLSGDTPQPAQQDIKFGDLTLRLTAPRAGAEIGAAGTRAEFRVDKPGWIHFGEGTRRLDVPVTVSGGQLRFDTRALEGAYGRPLPEAISQMARPTEARTQGANAIAASQLDRSKPCQPLVDGRMVNVGQLAYRVDVVPPSRPHYPHASDHVHIYQAHQAPSGRCFWKAINVQAPPPPLSAIPIAPFMK